MADLISPIFLDQTVKVFLALFIITDSLGNIPFFIGLTEEQTKKERRKTFQLAIMTGILLLAFFVVAGNLVLDAFSLSLNDMRIAGGILLFIIGVEILMRNHLKVEHKEDVGVMPLGCPLLVGPGAITTVLLAIKIYNIYAVIIGVVLCFLVIWLVLHYAEYIYKMIGRNGAMIITKISAIIIATIAVSFVRQGIQIIFHL